MAALWLKFQIFPLLSIISDTFSSTHPAICRASTSCLVLLFSAPVMTFLPQRLTTLQRPPPHPHRFTLSDEWTDSTHASRELPYTWTGNTTFTVRTDLQHQQPLNTTSFPTSTNPETPPMTTTPPTPPAMDTQDTQAAENGVGGEDDTEFWDSLVAPATESDTNMDPTPEPNQQPEVPSRSITSTSGTEPMQEPDPPAAPLPTPALAIPEHQQQLYQPPQPGETFNQLRARVDRQETLSLYQPHHGAVTYGPNRETFARETHTHTCTRTRTHTNTQKMRTLHHTNKCRGHLSK